MTKLNKFLIAALVVQGVLLVAMRLVPEEESFAQPKKLLGKLDAANVARLSITDDQDTTVVLEEQGGEWVLASGGGYSAQEDKVKEVLGKLAGLAAAEPVTDKKSHHRRLEVADEKFQRKVVVKLDGGEEHVFFLGSSPVVNKAHFRRVGEDKVYLAGEISTWDVGTSAGTWVDTSYFEVEKDQVVELRLKNQHSELALHKVDGKWAAAAPEGGEEEEQPAIKQSEVDSLLTTATSVKMQEPVSSKVLPDQRLGEDAAAVLTLVTEMEAQGGDEEETNAEQEEAQATTGGGAEEASEASEELNVARQEHILRVGAQKDKSRYAKSSSSKFVVLIGSWAADTFTDKKLEDLLEKKEESDAEAAD
jgi:hypothetical protein